MPRLIVIRLCFICLSEVRTLLWRETRFQNRRTRWQSCGRVLPCANLLTSLQLQVSLSPLHVVLCQVSAFTACRIATRLRAQVECRSYSLLPTHIRDKGFFFFPKFLCLSLKLGSRLPLLFSMFFLVLSAFMVVLLL
jgi:hypothetical protein